jgi:hypothetical protein
MAQLIIIPAHTVKLIDIGNSIPKGKFKKLYFQCALKEIKISGADREAHFRIIVYAGKRNISQKWKLGTKVDCQPDYSVPPTIFDLADYSEPVGFGNNEFYEFDYSLKQKKAKNADPQKVKQSDLMKKIVKLAKNKSTANKAFLSFEAKISKNPHVTYKVTLDDGTSANANPSPPADPY